MKRIVKISVIILLIGVVVFNLGCSNQSKTDQTKAESESAAEEKLTTTDVFGEIKAKQVKNIRLDLEARVVATHVEVGDKIKQGDKLITLDLSKPRDKLTQKREALEVAKDKLDQIKQGGETNLKQLKNKLQAEQKLYQAEQEQLTQKRTELAEESSPDFEKLYSKLEAEKDLYQQRQEELAQKKQLLAGEAISKQEFKEFQQSVDQQKQLVEEIELSIAETKYNKQEKIKELSNSLIDRKQRIEELKSKIKQQQREQQQNYRAQKAKINRLTREIKQLEKELNRSYLQGDKIVADIKQGIISEVVYKKGDIIDVEQKLVTILDIDQIIVTADVPEEFIADVKLGAEATIIPLADRDKKYQGQVTKIADLAVESGGETVVPVEITINNRDQFLRPNFNVDVEIEKKE